eukprot:g10955.t1
MFYSQIILAKKGPLGKIWIAAHWDKKLNKAQIFQTNINTSVENILQPTVPLALRMSGHLLLGLVRIYSRKVKYLMTDASEALVKIQMAFRPGATDMPAGATVAAPGAIEAQGFGDFDDVGMDGVNIDDIHVFSNAFAVEGVDNWMEAAPVNLGRRADINLDPADSMSMISGQDRNGSFMLDVDMSFGGNRSDINMDSRISMDARSRSSRVSDIEAVRDADNSGLRSGRLSVSVSMDDNVNVMATDNDHDKEMGGAYDDLGPPTHPNELALGAGVGGGAELDDAADMMEMGDGGFDGPEYDLAPAFNPDLGDLEQGGEADGVAQEDGRALNDSDSLNLALDDAGFSRTDLPARGGVDADTDVHQAQEEKGEEEEPPARPKTTRTRKRKLVMNQVTLIDMATMKAQLQDTSDITRKRWRGPRRLAQEVRSPEEQLMEPLMSSLAPPLHNMLRACMTPGGFPFPFRKRAPPAEEAEDHAGREEGGEGEVEEEIEGPDPTEEEEEEEQEDVELTRRADDSRQSIAGCGLKNTSLGSSFKDGGAGLDMDGTAGGEGGDVDAFELAGDGMDMDMDLGGGAGAGVEGMDGMEDFGGGFEADPNLNDIGPDMQAGDELDLGGGVNDLEASRDEHDHQDEASGAGGVAVGVAGREDGPDETGALPQHKWHPHTVKVLRLVKKQLKAKEKAKDPRGLGVTHASLARGAKRRTAAGAFFELLQLKTWDFVELSQQEPYGDINVTAGPRLNDEVQAANV